MTPNVPRSKIPELLAPAGSPAAFRAAIAAGADAVYLSGKQFGARKFAPNFTDTEIQEAIAVAHAQGVQVYVTVNTLIHDRELAGAAEYLVRLYTAGVDAVLVQDTGLAALAQKIVPDLTLHASTQLTIHDAAGVRWAAEQSLSRVVLARELSIGQVRTIAEKTRDTGVGLEIFLHGALCYAYSGQCLLSSYIGGRSGNRGMCAQPCRKPYTLVTSEADAYGRPVRPERRPLPCRYLLSPRDLCSYERLGELAESPVVSLKIEGRMKSPEYVATVVSVYRRALDALAQGPWKPSPEDMRDLLLAFNRGFTDGHLFGSRGPALMGRDAPDNRGIAIGTVAGYDAATRTVAVKTTGPLVPGPGDGLFVITPGGEDRGMGFSLNNTPVPGKKGIVIFSVPGPVKPGAQVFLTASRELDARVRQIIARPDGSLRHPVPLDIVADIDHEGQLTLRGTVQNPRGRTVAFQTGPEPVFVPARSHPLPPAELEDRFRKTGGTPFVVRDLVIRSDGEWFAPAAAINRVRRDFLVLAEQQMISSGLPTEKEVQAAENARRSLIPALCTESPGSPGLPVPTGPELRLAVFADSPENAREAAGAGCDIIWYETGAGQTCEGPAAQTSRDPVRELEQVLEICREYPVSLLLNLPRIPGEDAPANLIPFLPGLAEKGLAGVMTDNPGTAAILREQFPSLAIAGAAGLNIFNHVSAGSLAGRFGLLVLSPELSGDEIRVLIRTARACGQTTGFALIVQGSGPAMLSADDLSGVLLPKTPVDGPAPARFTGIGDATGRIFPVHADRDCRTHILNADETCLLDQLPAIRDMGIGVIAVDARFRPPAYTRAMTRLYREAITAVSVPGPETAARLAGLKKSAKAISLGGITASHFLRGLTE